MSLAYSSPIIQTAVAPVSQGGMGLGMIPTDVEHASNTLTITLPASLETQTSDDRLRHMIAQARARYENRYSILQFIFSGSNT